MQTNSSHPATGQGNGCSDMKAIIMEPCAITARGMRKVLEQQCAFTGQIIEVNSLAKLSSVMHIYQPRILIMELCGEGESVLDGLKLITLWQYKWPRCRLVICTGMEEPQLLQLLSAAEVRGILLKQEPANALAQSVRTVLSGRKGYSFKVRSILEQAQPCLKPLTLRELDVLCLLFSGKSVTSVAQVLHRDVRTVSTHKRNVMQKLGFRNDGELFIQGKWLINTDPALSC